MKDKLYCKFSKDDECYTPKTIVDIFGPFDYDPATTSQKAEEFNIENYDTIETDGLKADWSRYERIWINPPFSRKWEFLQKAVETYLNSNNTIYILLPVMCLTTKKFNEITKDIGGIIYLPDKRIQFESGNKRKFTSINFGTIIFKLENEKDIVIKRIVI